MKALSLIAVFTAIALYVWLPARIPPQQFELQAAAEAMEIRTSDRVLLPELVCRLTGKLLGLRKELADFPDRVRLRPHAPERVRQDEFAEIGRAAERTLRTPWLRAMKSMTVMALQRLAMLAAAWTALLPFTLALIADGLTARRIRSAEMRAASPTLWKIALIAAVLLPLSAATAVLFPSFPTAVLPAFPMLHAFLLRQCAASWHRFI